MPRLKLRYLIIVIITALLMGAWLVRTQLSEMAAASAMRSSGLSDIDIDIQQLGFRQSHISGINLSFMTESGVIELAASDLSISYNTQQLMQGRIGNIAIHELTLHHTPDTTPRRHVQGAAGILEPLKFLALFRHAVRKYIIFDNFKIDRIIMQGEYFGAFQNIPLQLDGKHHAGSTFAVFTLLEQDSPAQAKHSRQFVINSLSQDTFSAEFKFSNTPGPTPAEFNLSIHDTGIHGNYTINSGKLKQWLLPLQISKDITASGEIKGAVSLQLNSDREIIANFKATSDSLALNTYQAGNATINLNIRIPDADSPRLIQLTNTSFIQSGRVNRDALSLDDVKIRLSGELSGTDGSQMFNGNLYSDSLTVIHDAKTLQLGNIHTNIVINNTNTSADGTFITSNLPAEFTYHLEHVFTDNSGKLSIKTTGPLDLHAEQDSLSQLLTPWPYDFDLYTGYINLALHASWTNKSDLELTSGIKLQQTGGNYGELVFSGLNFEHNLKLLPTVYSTEASKIKITHVDSGVTASNISADLALLNASTGTLPQLAVGSLRGEIFDGVFSADNFTHDFNSAKNSFTLTAEDIDLAQVVATQQLRDISVSGRVNGKIPIEIDNTGISIKQGAFLNDIRSGTIRYNPASGTDQLKQNPLTGIALDALRDFRYSHLSADVNFTPQGMLTINLQLKGTSPELDTKRPVHLNINTEQNLLSLLKSLRYAEGVSTVIDQRVRRQYEIHRNNRGE